MNQKTAWFLIAIPALFILAACAAQPAIPVDGGGVNLDDLPIPADVPILDSAGDVSVDVGDVATSITYLADTTSVQVVADYYENALVSVGWEDTETVDVVAGESATVVGVNASGDEIAVAITYDDDADRVQVSISVERAE